ncbi:MAG: hypothetical protein GWO11_00485 [Desulfuromonadales bacterium]|nr:hypothetical protein [Desulfuromonadales bacterium]NIR33003.1 hypothetical protein [Desulfuromonadales bacterium]NIS40552.1 hypothetical protein [Desulfuromonadales bacterium]
MPRKKGISHEQFEIFDMELQNMRDELMQMEMTLRESGSADICTIASICWHQIDRFRDCIEELERQDRSHQD